jgi:hypothetical protein
MNLHKILIFSSCLFLLPYLNIVLFVEETPSNIYEKYMSMLLVCNFIFSVLFWHNPINKSIIHRIDGFFAKLSVVTVFLYVAFIKDVDPFNENIFFLLYLFFISFARLSNKRSRKQWCSNSHIFYHFLMHLSGIFGGIVAFL